MKATSSNSARIEFRTASDTKALIEQAAALQSMTVSDFAESILVEKAREVIRVHETRVLSARDRELFLRLLESPPEPNGALLKAAQTFKDAVDAGNLVV